MKVAVFGLFQNENFFIPHWQKYYGDLFGFENLYAIGDLQNDSAMKLFEPKVNLINYSPEFHANFGEHNQIVINMQRQLLEKYDVAIFAEADQFFIPNPEKYSNLLEYLEKNKDDYIKVTGYNLLHIIEEEGAYDPAQSITNQRSFWYRYPLEDKLFIVRKPVQAYTWGFHTGNVPDVPNDPDLINLHCHAFDFAHANSRRHSKTVAGKWHEYSGKNKPGFHTWIHDQELKNMWYEYSYHFGLQLMPVGYRGIV
jgi:hypothetical protein